MGKEQLTIGYVLDDTLDKYDGVQQAVLAIGEHMRALGHDVHYLTSSTSRTDIKNVHSLAQLIPLKFNGNSVRTPLPTSRKKIRQLFKDIQFDVLHVQMPYSPLLAARVMRLAPSSVKIVGTFHILPYNNLVTSGTRLLSRMLGSSRKRINKAYAVSQPALEFMERDFRVNGTVLANPVDFDFFHSFATTKRSEKKKRIVFVGRFEERKGVRQLIRAYERLDKKTEVELVMCGRGPLSEEIALYNQTKSLGVLLPGFISEEDKARYLASADVAIFPSTGGESFGIVLTEAMSAGAGVTLGGSNPGYTSVLQPWPETLFDANNPDAFDAVLRTFLNDSRMRSTIGVQQHKYARQFDINLIAERLLTEAYR